MKKSAVLGVLVSMVTLLVASVAQGQTLPTITRNGTFIPKGGGTAVMPSAPTPEAVLAPEEQPLVGEPSGEEAPAEPKSADEADAEMAGASEKEDLKKFDFSGVKGTLGIDAVQQWTSGIRFGGAVRAGLMGYPVPTLGLGLQLRGLAKGGNQAHEFGGSLDVTFHGRVHPRVWLGLDLGPMLRASNPDDGRLGTGPNVDREEVGTVAMHIAPAMKVFVLPQVFFRLALDMEIDVENGDFSGTRVENAETFRFGSEVGFGLQL